MAQSYSRELLEYLRKYDLAPAKTTASAIFSAAKSVNSARLAGQRKRAKIEVVDLAAH